MLFTGKYDYSIDAKHRLAIPAKIRSRLGSRNVGTAFYAVIGPNGALWLWPEATFERMAGDIDATLAPPRPLMDFDEITFPEAQHVDLDTSGRVRIPEEMLGKARLGSRVLILGMRNHLEVWDPSRWEEHVGGKQANRSDINQVAGPLLAGGNGAASA